MSRVAEGLSEGLAIAFRCHNVCAEGVSAPMIEGYLRNVTKAADAVWQFACKVDAVVLQVGHDLHALTIAVKSFEHSQL